MRIVEKLCQAAIIGSGMNEEMVFLGKRRRNKIKVRRTYGSIM